MYSLVKRIRESECWHYWKKDRRRRRKAESRDRLGNGERQTSSEASSLSSFCTLCQCKLRRSGYGWNSTRYKRCPEHTQNYSSESADNLNKLCMRQAAIHCSLQKRYMV
jgi:hypothetical protein